MIKVSPLKRCGCTLFAAVLATWAASGCQAPPQTASGAAIDQNPVQAPEPEGVKDPKGLKGLFGGSSEEAPQASIESTARGVAFARDPDIFFLPPDSSAPVKVARGFRPVLDPTGQQMAFLSLPPSGADPLWVSMAKVDGKAVRVVHRSKTRLNDLDCSSQGDLLLATWTGAEEALLILLKAGSGFSEDPIEVARSGQNGANGVYGPRWSPDGGSVIFHDLTNLFQVSLTGAVIEKTPINVITGKANSVDSTSVFSVSPTNPNLYAYTSAVPGTKRFDEVMGGEPNSALFTFDTASGKRQRLSPPDMVCMDPTWTPDGRAIILGGYREAHYTQAYPFRIYRINPDGSGLKELARGENPSS